MGGLKTTSTKKNDVLEQEKRERELAATSIDNAIKAINFLQKGQNRTVSYNNPDSYFEDTICDIGNSDFFLYKIEEITFEEKFPRKEALENILGTFKNIKGINFLYAILREKSRVSFYLGVIKDLFDKESTFDLNDIASSILEPSIKGNFRGCHLTKPENELKQSFLNTLKSFSSIGMVEGIPIEEQSNDSKIQFQGVERLVEVMLSSDDNFGLVVIAKPYDDDSIACIEHNLHKLYETLAPLSRCTIQATHSHSRNYNKDCRREFSKYSSKTVGKNEATTDSEGSNHVQETRKDVSNSTQVSSLSNTGEVWQNTKAYADNDSDYQDSSSCYESYSLTEQGQNVYNSALSESTNDSESVSHSKNIETGLNRSFNRQYNRVKSSSDTELKGSGFSKTTELEVQNKAANIWLKYLDEYMLPRIERGKGKGLFQACTLLFGEHETTITCLGNSLSSLYSGSKGNRTPLALTFRSNKELFKDETKTDKLNEALKKYVETYFNNLQLPRIKCTADLSSEFAAAFSKYINGDSVFCGNWITAGELGVLAGMPQKEVIGMRLREEVEFGLNISENVQEVKDTNTEHDNDRENANQQEGADLLELGNLIQSGSETNIPIYLSKRNLDKHTFVTGVTGSGKTNTCRNILIDSKLPFWVVEPAKTEYRVLKKDDDSIIFFTPGNNKGAPFFLNPFELFPGEAITSRADMIKATFEATFHMEAAIPQLLEAAIYKAYENKGWDIGNNTWNGKTQDDPDGPFCNGVHAFPTLGEYNELLAQVVKEQGFDERLHDEYLGTMRALLQGLLAGAKGMMFNTPRSVDFKELVEKKVVLELEDIRNGSEKSLIMGFVMTNLVQAVKAKYFEERKKGKNFQHITLIEEAHRLLSRYQPGDSMNKKHGVEVFSDILAEVRKYGESMIIVDQIPDKMTPEVLKNTNTKIVHKIFAQDDKDAIGNTMALNDEQKKFLSNLVTGRAIVFTQNWTKAVQVQIKKYDNDNDKENDTEDNTEDESLAKIHLGALKYYKNTAKRGVLPGLETIKRITEEKVEKYLLLMESTRLAKIICERKKSGNWLNCSDCIAAIKTAIKNSDVEITAAYVYYVLFHENIDEYKQNKVKDLVHLINACTDEKKIESEILKTYHSIL